MKLEDLSKEGLSYYDDYKDELLKIANDEEEFMKLLELVGADASIPGDAKLFPDTSIPGVEKREHKILLKYWLCEYFTYHTLSFLGDPDWYGNVDDMFNSYLDFCKSRRLLPTGFLYEGSENIMRFDSFRWPMMQLGILEFIDKTKYPEARKNDVVFADKWVKVYKKQPFIRSETPNVKKVRIEEGYAGS